MRHESIQTTLKYYVGRKAQKTAEVVWKTQESGNTFGNRPQNQAAENCRNSVAEAGIEPARGLPLTGF